MKKFLAMLLAMTMILSVMAFVPAMAEGETKAIIGAISGDPKTMDPTLNSYARGSKVLQQLFRGLYKLSEDGEFVPAMAEGCEISEDGLTYTFTLRDGLKWSDGSALNAHDFEYSWKRVLNPETASKAVSDLWPIKNGKAYSNGECTADEVGVKATDDLTLVVELEQPTSWFITLTAITSYFPVKAEVVEAEEPWTNGTCDTTYISNGPFMLKEMASMDKIVMVKNPNYYNADEVKLDSVTYVIIEDAATELTAYNNGEINVAFIENTLSIDAMQQYGETAEYNTNDIIGIWYSDFNCQLPEFSDKRVRQAFAMSIDRAQLLQVMNFNSKPVYGFVPYAQPSLTDSTKSYRDVAGDMFSEDVAKAQELMAEAGYPNGEGFPVVKIVVPGGNQPALMAQVMQAFWQTNLGVTCEITTLSDGYWDELDAGNFSTDRNGYTTDFTDPSSNLLIWTTGSNAYENGWDDPEYDALYKAAMAEVDPAAREAGLIEAEKYLVDQMPGMPLFVRAFEYLVKSNISGVTTNKIGHINFEYADIA